MATIALSDLKALIGGLATEAINSPVALDKGTHYLVSTGATISGLTLLMPPGTAGAVVRFSDSDRTWGSKPLTLNAAGADTFGPNAATTVVLDSDWQFAQFMWNDLNGWWDRDDALSTTTVEEFSRYTLINSNTNLSSASISKLAVDTSGGPVTVFLNSSPTIGDIVQIADAQSSFSLNTLTIDGNGNNVLGALTFPVSTDNALLDIVYVGGTNGWTVRA